MFIEFETLDRRALVCAVIKQESGGKVDAVSHAGAKGLMQLMDGTANDMLDILKRRAEVSLGAKWEPFNAEMNIRCGALYLASQLNHFRNVRLALAAYNWGPANVARLMNDALEEMKGIEELVRDPYAVIYQRLPSETWGYVVRVTEFYQVFLKNRELSHENSSIRDLVDSFYSGLRERE